MEQMQTAQRLAGRSFGISGVLFWGKLTARRELFQIKCWTNGYECVELPRPIW